MDTTLTDRPPIGPFSLDEFLSWEGEPDVRYELVDGWAYAMNPPGFPHSRVVVNLMRLLDPVYPPGYEIFVTEFGWVLHPGQPNFRLPDLSIVPIRAQATGPGWVERAPLLAVEVISPSSRRYDLVRKRADYARAGLQHYWVIDPVAPSITVFSGDGLFRTTEVHGDDGLELTEPFPVRLVPGDLVRPPAR